MRLTFSSGTYRRRRQRIKWHQIRACFRCFPCFRYVGWKNKQSERREEAAGGLRLLEMTEHV